MHLATVTNFVLIVRLLTKVYNFGFWNKEGHLGHSLDAKQSKVIPLDKSVHMPTPTTAIAVIKLTINTVRTVQRNKR